MFIGAIAGGVGTATTITLTYVPEELFFVTATTTPSQLLVNVSGDGIICNLNAAGLDEVRN